MMEGPFYIQWHITNLCHLRCRHCYQDDFSSGTDLDGAGLKKVSDNIMTALREWEREAFIHLTGGEPLLKPEIFFLLDELNGQRRVGELGIITNGVSFNPVMIKRLSNYSKLKKMKISLDGADAAANDAIRPKGTFRKVIQNLSLLEKEGRFDIILMFTVMKRNFRNLLPLVRLCQDLGVDGLVIERFIPWGRGREIGKEVLGKEEWKELIETLLEFFSIEAGETLPYQAFEIIFEREGIELLGAPCVIGRDGLCIMPEGNVFPCRRFPIPIGNLLSEALHQIWEKSEILEKLRRKENLKGKCGSCDMEDCRGCRSLALSLAGDYLGEDPHCWYRDPLYSPSKIGNSD
jgi:radical SAM protein with 4Fe4S-binding SPASM domain